MIPHELAHLPVYADMPVPYVACWSDETTGPPMPGHFQWWGGIRWIHTNRPHGVPDFGSTNSHRQRECMRRRRCQICGFKGADTWVVPDDRELMRVHVMLWGEGLVLNPPVHARCLELSRKICPHLRAVEPLAVIEHTGAVSYVACTATSANGVQTAAVMLAEAKAEEWVGRELIVRLVL